MLVRMLLHVALVINNNAYTALQLLGIPQISTLGTWAVQIQIRTASAVCHACRQGIAAQNAAETV